MAGQNPLNPELDQEDENQGQGQQQPNQTVLGAPQATVQGGGMQQAQPSAPQQKGSGRFTNLQNFMQANKNFAAGQGGLAGKMAGKVGQQVGQAKQTLASEKQKFGQTLGGIKQEATQTKEAMNPSLDYLKNIQSSKYTYDEQGNITGVKQAAQPGEMELAVQPETPAQPELDINKASENISKAQNLQYRGPESLGATKELEAQKQSLGELGKATATQEGRFGLLNRFFGRPTYSAGQQRLDQLLVQGNQEQLQNLRGTRQQTAQFGGAFDKAKSQALQDVAQTRGEVKDIAGQAQALTKESESAASQRLAANVEQRNNLVRQVEMMGAQGQAELKQSLANAGLDLDDLRIALDPNLAFQNPQIANAVLAATSQATEGTMDIEAAKRVNALRNLAGRKDLLAVGTEEAGSDINVGIGGQLQGMIGQSRGDIDLYKKAAQGSEAFSGEEESQLRERFISEKAANTPTPAGVDRNQLVKAAANWGANPYAMDSLIERQFEGKTGTQTTFKPGVIEAIRQLREGLNSKEDVVQYARDTLGTRLRQRFTPVLGKAY
jgi:hypothetical protein